MDHRAETRTFLQSRRAKITPEQAGLFAGGERRVAGLRRGEVAMLAGVSVEYYTRMERGHLGGVSEGVLDAIARALRLDDAERAHLFDLARAANTTAARRRKPVQPTVRPSVQRILDALTRVPAFVRNNRFDIVATNSLGRALYSEMFAGSVGSVNILRFIFLDSRATRFYVDWERNARNSVGALRVEVGKNLHDRELSNVVGELATQSDAFRTMWAEHDVHVYLPGAKRVRHPDVGELELAHEIMALPGDEGLVMCTYSAEAGSASEDGLKLLESWSATTGSAGHR
ncbi:transcriptional regulator with XRE-family HTH domain [Kibdelosporangium banguiense]|uniref:Transcriptional regulator with XRE-family HTH domain n=1 Tax=Kibdelosporangium banguiense TaxID=1365924 RepID=A0ABS4TVD8_9PSEU|nr:helix-turn-helix transcriptional regulator [Kibdelosporangium banguiense]MBP2327896.1 transcriptional regulator with XRE-family HTH domain [Kibdelosporangium banguiense]